MFKNKQVIATALFLTFANFGQAGAAETPSADGARQGFDVLATVGAAFHDPRVATNATEVRRQGGFATAGAARWKGDAGRSSQDAGFDFPSVIGAAYHDARIAANAVEVRRQGGFATAGSVQWKGTSERTSPAAIAIPSVIGAAYHDIRVATGVAEVRRQGGFGITAAVRWLPAAPTETAVASEPVRLGAL